jgi:hypothetical protein
MLKEIKITEKGTKVVKAEKPVNNVAEGIVLESAEKAEKKGKTKIDEKAEKKEEKKEAPEKVELTGEKGKVNKAVENALKNAVKNSKPDTKKEDKTEKVEKADKIVTTLVKTDKVAGATEYITPKKDVTVIMFGKFRMYTKFAEALGNPEKIKITIERA